MINWKFWKKPEPDPEPEWVSTVPCSSGKPFFILTYRRHDGTEFSWRIMSSEHPFAKMVASDEWQDSINGIR